MGRKKGYGNTARMREHRDGRGTGGRTAAPERKAAPDAPPDDLLRCKDAYLERLAVRCDEEIRQRLQRYEGEARDLRQRLEPTHQRVMRRHRREDRRQRRTRQQDADREREPPRTAARNSHVEVEFFRLARDLRERRAQQRGR